MRKVRELIARASQDIELAKMHKQVKEYVTATLLYSKAVEKVLSALFISRTKKSPPKNASIEYLARKTGVPAEITAYMSSIQETDLEGNMDAEGFAEDLESGITEERSAERRAFYMDGLAKRLFDYVNAYAKV